MSIALRANDVVVQVGDSITATSGSVWDAWAGWRSDVNAHFAAVGTGIKPYFVNLGIPSAYVSTHLLAANLPQIIGAKPTVLVCCLGVNEAADGIAAATYETNLTSLVQQVVAGSGTLTYAKTVLITPWFLGEPTGAFEAAMDAIATAALSVATTLGCESLDIRTTRVLTGGHTADGVHPTATGKTWLVTALETKFTYDDTVVTLTGPERWRGVGQGARVYGAAASRGRGI